MTWREIFFLKKKPRADRVSCLQHSIIPIRRSHASSFVLSAFEPHINYISRRNHGGPDLIKVWYETLVRSTGPDVAQRLPLGGNLPSSTFNGIITKICASMRAYGCLQSAKQDAEKEGEEYEPKMQLILNPWNDGMDPAKEFRIFVPQLAARGVIEPHIKDLNISGISQYRWYSALQLPPYSAVQWVVDCVSEGAQRTLTDIVPCIESKVGTNIKDLLLRHGLSFDTTLQKNGIVQLGEMNPFGAMSGCGACLFH
jgi:hypothetical protein